MSKTQRYSSCIHLRYSQLPLPSEFLNVHSHLPGPKPSVAQYSASAHSLQPGRCQVAKNGWHSLWTWPAWFWFNHRKWGCNWRKMVLLCAVTGMYGFVQNGLMDWIRYTRNMWPWIMGKMKFYTTQSWRQPIFGQRDWKSTERVWLWRFPQDAVFSGFSGVNYVIPKWTDKPMNNGKQPLSNCGPDSFYSSRISCKIHLYYMGFVVECKYRCIFFTRD